MAVIKQNKNNNQKPNKSKSPKSYDHKFSMKKSDIKKDGTFSGYASVAGVVDSYEEVVVSGAFKSFLNGDISRVKLLAQHNDEKNPIGVITKLEEDDIGLYIEGKISDTEEGREVLTLMRDGALDEMSIGFLALDYYDEDGIRYITEIALEEISIVTWAANPEAKILQVKSKLKKGEFENVSKAGLLEIADAMEDVAELIRSACGEDGYEKGSTDNEVGRKQETFTIPRRTKSRRTKSRRRRNN